MSKVKFGKDHIQEQLIDFAVNEAANLIKTPQQKDTFNAQLKEFAADDSYKERFKGCGLNDKYGVEIFEYKPNRNLKTALLSLDVSGSVLKMDEESKATHLAKIIKVPSNIEAEYEEGQLVLLKVSDTVGYGYNPDWIFLNQFRDSNMELKVDTKDVAEKAPKFVEKMYDSAFLPPEEFDRPSNLITTFALDKYRILGPYEI